MKSATLKSNPVTSSDIYFDMYSNIIFWKYIKKLQIQDNAKMAKYGNNANFVHLWKTRLLFSHQRPIEGIS